MALFRFIKTVASTHIKCKMKQFIFTLIYKIFIKCTFSEFNDCSQKYRRNLILIENVKLSLNESSWWIMIGWMVKCIDGKIEWVRWIIIHRRILYLFLSLSETPHSREPFLQRNNLVACADVVSMTESHILCCKNWFCRFSRNSI